jgi:beta-glucosidase
MRVGILVAGIFVGVVGCLGPEEVFRPGQGGLSPLTGAAGTSSLPVLTTGSAGTGAPSAVAGTTGSAGTTAAAGTSGGEAGTTAGTQGAAGTRAAAGTTGTAGTGVAGTTAVGGSGGTSQVDGGAAGTSPRDAAAEAPPAAPYASTGWKATASVTAAGNADVVTHAFDGELATRWATGRNQAGNETFTLDLGATRSLSRVVLDATTHPTDFPVAWTLEVSTNGTAFTEAAMGKGSTVTDIRFTSRMARHVRVRQTGTTPAPNGAWWSIDEMRVYP